MYCSVEDIKRFLTTPILSNLTTGDDIASIDEAYIEERIAENTEFMDAILSQRYKLPLIETHIRLKYICVELTAFSLLSRYGNQFADTDKMAYIKDTALDKLHNIFLTGEETLIWEYFAITQTELGERYVATFS